MTGAGAQPVAYLVDIVPTTYLRQQDLGETFNGSVLDLFIERGEPALSHSRTDIMAEAADGALARKLHLQRGDMLLKLEAQLVARDGRSRGLFAQLFCARLFSLPRRAADGGKRQSQMSI